VLNIKYSLKHKYSVVFFYEQNKNIFEYTNPQFYFHTTSYAAI